MAADPGDETPRPRRWWARSLGRLPWAGRQRPRWLPALIAGAVVLVLLGSGIGLVTHEDPPEVPERCRPQGSKPVSTGSPTAVVLGDSYSAGLGLEDPKLAWSTILGRLEGWRTYTEAVSGTGFTTDGPCPGEEYAARLPDALRHHPEVLVIQGGLNDAYSPPGSRATALTSLIDRASDVPRIVVVGPPPAPRVRRAALQRVDAELRSACRPPRCTYVSALGWDLPYSGDRVHLTAAGHVQFAAGVSEALHGRG